MSLYIQAEVCISSGDLECDIAIPANDAWLKAMRNSVEHGGLIMLRFDNTPVGGDTGKVALTIGPTPTAQGVPGEEDDYLHFGAGANEPWLFGFLLDRNKLAELITALQLMQAHFPANEGMSRQS
jgi:hypothetical protein